MPVERYNFESFKEPYCQDGDLFHWLFAVDILVRKINHDSMPSVRVAYSKAIESGLTSFDVIWKTSDFNKPTGLCLNGPIAGYYVSKWYEREELVFVVKGRPVSIDGGSFSLDRALHKIVELESQGVDLTDIKAELVQPFVSFPRILAKMYLNLGYPIDMDTFLKNTIHSNRLYWDNTIMQKNKQHE